MTQLTFDVPLPNETNPKELAEDLSESQQKTSWYKGRVLSHSSIYLYKTCPQKWKFRYIDKVPEKPRSFFSFGKSVHAGLEYLFSGVKDGIPTIEELLANFRANWLRDGYESPQQEKWFFQEGERIIRGFYGKHKDELKKVFQVEFKFTVDIEGVPVMGYIDRIDSTPSGGLAILDYKTGKAFDRIRVRQEPQLTLYQMAVKKLLGKEVETVGLYHLNTLTAHVVPAHTAQQETDVVQGVLLAAKGINESKFDPKPEQGGQCQWCDYLQICPAFAGKKGTRAFEVPAPDSLAELADRLGRLDAKIQELLKSRDEVEKSILSRLSVKNEKEVEGKYFSVIHKPADEPNGKILFSQPREKKP